MIRRPPRSTRTDTLFPYTTLFRSKSIQTRRHHKLVAVDNGIATIDVKYQVRSEEHTSELQSLMRISYAVFCLKKKKRHKYKQKIEIETSHKHKTLIKNK